MLYVKIRTGAVICYMVEKAPLTDKLGVKILDRYIPKDVFFKSCEENITFYTSLIMNVAPCIRYRHLIFCHIYGGKEVWLCKSKKNAQKWERVK